MPEEKYCYDHPRPSVSSDCVLFGFDGKELFILLIERGKEPFKGMWALPGGFLEMDETAEQCAARELQEETGISGLELRQLGAFSDVDRDPRGRVISVAFYTIINPTSVNPVAGDDAAGVRWHRLNELPSLGFDHDLVLVTAIRRLKTDRATGTLPDEFAGAELPLP